MSTSERLDVTEIVGRVDIACETRRHNQLGIPDSASWVLWTTPCCERRKARGFICDVCLDHYLTTDNAVRCDLCDARVEPARKWIVRYEPINLPATPGGGN